MSDASEVSGASQRANQVLGDKRAAVIAAVEDAKNKVAERKAGADPTLTSSERKAIDRPLVGEAATKAMGKDPEEAVQVVEAVKEAIAPPPAAPEPAKTETPDEGKVGRLYEEVRRRERQNVEREARLRVREENAQRAEREVADAREAMAHAQRDPFGWWEKYHGIKRDAWGLTQENKGSPEQRVYQEQQNNQTAALQREIASLRQEREAEKQEAHRQRELDKFVAQATAGKDRWPLSSRQDPDTLKRRGYQIAVDEARQGVILSNDEVLDRLEEEYSRVAPARAPKTETPKPKRTETNGSEVKASQQPTLTSQGGEPNSKPPSPLKMSREQMIRHTVQVLQEQERARTKPA